jgi:hypothetical protein
VRARFAFPVSRPHAPARLRLCARRCRP